MLPFQLAPTTADESTTLQGMLDMQRSILLWKLDGFRGGRQTPACRVRHQPSGSRQAHGLGRAMVVRGIHRWRVA